MANLLFACVEIGDCVAALYGATLGNRATGAQERFGEQGLTGMAWSDQAYVANVSCCIGHKANCLLIFELIAQFAAEWLAMS